MRFIFSSIIVLLSFVSRSWAWADASAAPETARRHGPAAPDDQFPSHVFQLRPHMTDRVQLDFNYGLNQPILGHGFNAAAEVRYRRLVATYSHGQGLNYGTSFATGPEKAASASVRLPWSTGGGVGLILFDELWLLADLKVHRFEIDTAVDHYSYTNVTLGGELGWRYFIWKGFNVELVARYWPNVYSTAGKGVTLHDASGKSFLDAPAAQGKAGFLGNVLVGWAFNL
jgi:hypothetical protein